MKQDELKTLQILEALGERSVLSQREISRRLNISLGLANAFIRRLARKGYFKITTIPANRVKYLLTPKGLAEKSRLTLKSIEYSFNLYRKIKDVISAEFQLLEAAGVRRLALCGTGEVAELSYLFLQQWGMELAVVVDHDSGGKFFGREVRPLEALRDLEFDRVLVASLGGVEETAARLAQLGVEPAKITLFDVCAPTGAARSGAAS